MVPESAPENARQPVLPLDPPMVPITLTGLVAWVVAGLVVLLAGGPAGWLRISLAGLVIGLALLAVMVVRDRRRARRQASESEVPRHRSG
jgi:Flp pilus assembly protein TadB